MQNQVIADIEIEDQKIAYYSSVILSQKFNEHHSFSIRIKYDVLEKPGSFSLSNAQKLIGKSATIKLLQADTLEVAYEFHGLVCEINIEQGDNFTSDLVLKGYSPTILLENGPNFSSYYNKKLQDIAGTLTQALSQVNCPVNNNPQYKTPITYICQYKESAFHFLNRLSAHFGEWFYYDGQQLNFGKPSNSPGVEITYGVDVQTLQVKLRILPLTFSGYSYSSKDDKFITADAPGNVDGLDDHANYVLNESNKIFSEAVSIPVKQRIESKSDLDAFVKQQKTAMAANLEVVSAISDNPAVSIGAIADIKISALSENGFVTEDGGKFLVTGIEHYVNANGKYYNNFEGIPSGITALPVNNIAVPLAEPQIATVKDNKDPQNMGRIRVQMLWQQANDEMTDWLRVMTPDAGGGKDGAKNRGFLVVPEPGDQVLVCFRYNDPDRPFVMGSMFHGKTGGGGGQGNNTKSLNSKSGHTISLDDGKGITIVDKSTNNKIEIDGTNTITVTAAQKIVLTNGKSTLTMDGDSITLTGAHVVISGSADIALVSSGHGFFSNAGGESTMQGSKSTVIGSDEATLTGKKSTVNGDDEATLNGKTTTVNGDTTTSVKSSGPTSIEGAIVKLN
ncbi:MAG TPA: phage baseplate assembly protein V [Parafilimonas sp.]|nr:phage baseplate assembly protein V [Parafilimonas sp.]